MYTTRQQDTPWFPLYPDAALRRGYRWPWLTAAVCLLAALLGPWLRVPMSPPIIASILVGLIAVGVGEFWRGVGLYRRAKTRLTVSPEGILFEAPGHRKDYAFANLQGVYRIRDSTSLVFGNGFLTLDLPVHQALLHEAAAYLPAIAEVHKREPGMPAAWQTDSCDGTRWTTTPIPENAEVAAALVNSLQGGFAAVIASRGETAEPVVLFAISIVSLGLVLGISSFGTVLRHVLTRTVRISPEGVSVRCLFRSWRMPWHEVASAKVSAQGVELQHEGKGRMVVPLPHPSALAALLTMRRLNPVPINLPHPPYGLVRADLSPLMRFTGGLLFVVLALSVLVFGLIMALMEVWSEGALAILLISGAIALLFLVLGVFLMFHRPKPAYHFDGAYAWRSTTREGLPRKKEPAAVVLDENDWPVLALLDGPRKKPIRLSPGHLPLPPALFVATLTLRQHDGASECADVVDAPPTR